jgi:hypothetical protein
MGCGSSNDTKLSKILTLNRKPNFQFEYTGGVLVPFTSEVEIGPSIEKLKNSLNISAINLEVENYLKELTEDYGKGGKQKDQVAFKLNHPLFPENES